MLREDFDFCARISRKTEELTLRTELSVTKFHHLVFGPVVDWVFLHLRLKFKTMLLWSRSMKLRSAHPAFLSRQHIIITLAEVSFTGLTRSNRKMHVHRKMHFEIFDFSSRLLTNPRLKDRSARVEKMYICKEPLSKVSKIFNEVFRRSF